MDGAGDGEYIHTNSSNCTTEKPRKGWLGQKACSRLGRRRGRCNICGRVKQMKQVLSKARKRWVLEITVWSLQRSTRCHQIPALYRQRRESRWFEFDFLDIHECVSLGESAAKCRCFLCPQADRACIFMTSCGYDACAMMRVRLVRV